LLFIVFSDYDFSALFGGKHRHLYGSKCCVLSPKNVVKPSNRRAKLVIFGKLTKKNHVFALLFLSFYGKSVILQPI